MLPHAEIIVAAPDRHLAHGAVGTVPARLREGARDPLQLGEGPVTPFKPGLGEKIFKMGIEVHGSLLRNVRESSGV
jgi:hypothetical protein